MLHSKDEIQVTFQDWQRFGLDSSDVAIIAEGKPDLVYVLDLGSSRGTIEAIQSLSAVTRVVFIHHHVPEVEVAKLATPTLTCIHDSQNCAAGLVYEYSKVMGVEPSNEKFFRY